MNGLDLLGLGSPHWNTPDTVRVFSELQNQIAVGAFDTGWPNSFGDPTKNLLALIATGKVAAVRIHLWWNPAPGHPTGPEVLPWVKKRCPHWEQFAKDHTNVKVYLSPHCEYGTDLDHITALIQAIKNLAPSCIPVCCPMKSPVVTGCIIEAHGDPLHTADNQIASFDGAGCADRNVPNWLTNTALSPIQFLWHYRFNMAESGNTSPPSQRTASPDYNYIKGILRLFEPLGVPPKPTFQGSIHPIQSPNLVKPYAEDQANANQRDNKPLVEINGISADHLNIVACNGLALGALAHYGDNRFYSGWKNGINLYGWQISDKAIRLSGSPWVWLNTPGTHNYFGPCRLDFRFGFFEH